MSAPDLEVIKEIPGYKVILKAILKSQIQQLVEQLAAHTEEESVILTASVSDGTLSHLGSDSGKCFLQDHEDVKSQFLGFCLKKHHSKKQEEDRLEALRNIAQVPAYSPRPRFPQSRSPRQMAPQSFRGRGARPEPYPVNRVRVSRPPDTTQGSPTSASNFIPSLESGIKLESVDPEEEADNVSYQEESGVEPKNDSYISAQSNPSMSTAQGSDSLGDSAFPESAGSNSDMSNISGDRDTSQEGDDSKLAQDVKVETMLERDMELEITGVEMGASQDPQGSSDSWAADMMGTMGFDTTAATGNQGEAQQGYREDLPLTEKTSPQPCTKPKRPVARPRKIKPQEKSNKVAVKRNVKSVTSDAASEGKGRSYRHFNLKQKLEVVEFSKLHGIRAAARHFKIPKSSVSNWYSTDYTCGLRNEEGMLPKSGRPLTYPKELDQKIYMHVLEQHELKKTVRVTDLCKYAVKIIKPVVPKFAASQRWAECFTKRHNLQLRDTTSQSKLLSTELDKTPVSTLDYEIEVEHENDILIILS